jgi:DNA invertase Pin-like site-specific DNA recombinase
MRYAYKAGPDVIAKVQAWDAERRKLGKVDDAVTRWRAERRRIGMPKKVASELGVSLTTLYSILKNGSTLKKDRR